MINLVRYFSCTGIFAELLQRVEWQWQLFVDSQLAHRSTFAGLAQVDVTAVRRTLSCLSPDRQALYRLSLTGGFYTADSQSHWTEHDNQCKWCGAPDSLRHRLWLCPQTECLRQKWAPRASGCHMDLPPVMALHGWAVRPPTWLPFVKALLAVPHPSRTPQVPFDLTAWNHVFTDGSCFCQPCPSVRLAAWSAFLVSALSPTWCMDCPRLLGSGPLPGLVQTSFRAELFAFAFVLHCAAQVSAKVVVWSDCQAVILKFHLLTKGKGKLKLNSPNADLWNWILESVDVLTLDRVQVRKVAAHQTLTAVTTRQEFWETWYNREADRRAKRANLDRPSPFWDLWHAHSVATATALALYDEVWALHVAVGQFSVAFDDKAGLDEAPLPQPREPRVFDMKFDIQAWTGQLDPSFCQTYGHAMADRLRRWCEARILCHQHCSWIWVSFVHAYVDYQLTFGCAGPIQSQGQWLDPMMRPHLDPEKHCFQKRLRWFTKFLKAFCQ